MSTRRYGSSNSKLQKKIQVEFFFVESQKRVMNKFIEIENELENINGCSLNGKNNNIDIGNNNNREVVNEYNNYNF